MSKELICDLCNSNLKYIDAYHFSGYLKSKLKRDIHICPKCYNKYKLNNLIINFDIILKNDKKN